jgi:hypothetical protein
MVASSVDTEGVAGLVDGNMMLDGAVDVLLLLLLLLLLLVTEPNKHDNNRDADAGCEVDDKDSLAAPRSKLGDDVRRRASILHKVATTQRQRQQATSNR